MKMLIDRALCLLISICPLAVVYPENAARIVKYSQTEIIPIRAAVSAFAPSSFSQPTRRSSFHYRR